MNEILKGIGGHLAIDSLEKRLPNINGSAINLVKVWFCRNFSMDTSDRL